MLSRKWIGSIGWPRCQGSKRWRASARWPGGLICTSFHFHHRHLPTVHRRNPQVFVDHGGKRFVQSHRDNPECYGQQRKRTGPAAVICPAGGYYLLTIDYEGDDVAVADLIRSYSFVQKYWVYPRAKR